MKLIVILFIATCSLFSIQSCSSTKNANSTEAKEQKKLKKEAKEKKRNSPPTQGVTKPTVPPNNQNKTAPIPLENK